MNYERNRKYFNGTAGPASGLIMAGVTLAIVGFIVLLGIISADVDFDDVPSSFWFLFFLLLIGGIIMIISGLKAKPSILDSEIDMELMQYFERQNLKEKALDKLGLDESEVMEIAPVYFDGYHYEGAQVKIGLDNKARSSLGRAVYFFFTKNEVHCYMHTVSLVENFCSEDTDTYFYSDIVSVSTTMQSGSVTPVVQNNGFAGNQMQVRTYQYDCFKLTTTGGTSVQASLRDKAGAERSINGMRNLIKAKKQSV